MRLRLLLNPAAGRGRAQRKIGEAMEYLRSRGAEVELIRSHDRDHMMELAHEASLNGFDRVVACGGDGSVHLVVRGVDLSKVTLGLLPLGSGDDFAKVLGVPKDVKGACDVLLDGVVREVDVATANGIRYVGVAGLGFDSEVNRFANERVKFLSGPIVYLYSIFRVLPRFHPRPVKVHTSDAIRDEELMFAVVGNTRQYGGGIRIAPAAKVDDRLLDLYMIKKCSKLDLITTLPLGYTGKHTRRSFVEHVIGEEFTIESERKLDVYADGEYVTHTPVTFRLSEERLRVVVPAEVPSA